MSNRIQGPMMAPAHEEQSSKIRPNLQLLEEGPQQCILIGMVDVGTSTINYTGNDAKDVRQIYLIFEYPELKQLVYEDDVEPRSKIKYERFTYSLYDKANLHKALLAINNGKYAPSDFEKINLFDFIGSRLLTSITHVANKKDPSIIYDNIETYMKVGKMPEPENFISDGKRYMFYIDSDKDGKVIGENFKTENFAELPQFMREKLQESFEGISYKASGGTFAEPIKNDNAKSESKGTTAPPPSEFSIPKNFEFTDVMGKNEPYENYRKAGWTDKQLLDKGFLKKVAKSETPPPAPAEETAPSIAPPPPSDDDEDDNPFANDEDDDLPY